MFRNVDIKNSDTGELPRRKRTTFRTLRKFEIKNQEVLNVRSTPHEAQEVDLRTHRPVFQKAAASLLGDTMGAEWDILHQRGGDYIELAIGSRRTIQCTSFAVPKWSTTLAFSSCYQGDATSHTNNRVSRREFATYRLYVNPINAELNPICHLLALVGAHHILHVSRIRVKASGYSPVHRAARLFLRKVSKKTTEKFS